MTGCNKPESNIIPHIWKIWGIIPTFQQKLSSHNCVSKHKIKLVISTWIEFYIYGFAVVYKRVIKMK